MGKINKTHKEQTFATDIGQRAIVDRTTMAVEKASIPNRKLADIGRVDMVEADTQLQHYTYLGSAAVHVYVNTMVNSLVFASQTHPLELYKCPESVAAKAFDDLLGEMKQMYGKRRGKLRSGF